jgi:hypothetical protein
MITQSHAKVLGGVKFLAVVNAVGFILTLLFWGLVFFRHVIPYPGELGTQAEKANAAVTYAFMISDGLYSLPLLFLSAIGLWRGTVWGWLSCQMVNVLWIYSMTVILIRDVNSTISPGGILFTPFALVSIWGIPYLWMKRTNFGISNNPTEGAPPNKRL